MKKNKFIFSILCSALISNVFAETNQPTVIYETQHDTSPPLSSEPAASSDQQEQDEVKPYAPPEAQLYNNLVLPSVTEYFAETKSTDTSYKLNSLPIKGFLGIGVGLKDYQPITAPPDTNGAAGLTQYVQWSNPGFGVFDKATGKILDGFPKYANTLFQGTGGLCETTNRGDGIVKYDQFANRWVISKFAFPDQKTGPFAQCIAVSVTSDAAGAYYRYEFPFDSLNDYGKLGMWSDAYYLTVNLVGPKTFGPRICALDRNAMLSGKAASMQCVQLDFLAAAAILPADLDGKTLPPSGTPEYLMGFKKPNTLKLYKFHADFIDPKKASLSDPVNITVSNFMMPCEKDAGDNCAPQPNTTMRLDTLSDRLMNRLVYRQFSDHGSLLATHTILRNPPHTESMIRWYEIRFAQGSTTPALYQTGNHPLLKNGWAFAGSIAMDKFGNIAFGYSKSSNTLYPSIGVSARLANAPLGKLSISATVVKGGGPQNNGTRWGDYSGMSIDPADDCTFWYTNEYRQANAFNWSTYIANFKMPGC